MRKLSFLKLLEFLRQKIMMKIISNVIILYTKIWKKARENVQNRETFHRKIRQKLFNKSILTIKNIFYYFFEL